MMYTDFSFLKEKYPVLYKIMCQAVDNINIDTDTTIYKVRKFTEELVYVLLHLENIEFDNSMSLNKKIELLEQSTNIDYIEYFHLLRVLGNKVVHGGRADRDLTISAVNLAFYLSQLLMTNYHNMTFITDKKEKEALLEAYKENRGFSISKEDNIIFNELMNDLTLMIFTYIIDKKLNGLGYIEEVGYISFTEFHNYFIECLKTYSSISTKNMKNIIHIKNILKKKFNTNDNDYINNIICEDIYIKCPWNI